MHLDFVEKPNTLCECLPIAKGVVCFIGGGGKTSLIRSYAHDLSKNNKVIVMTTTRMYPPEEMQFCNGDISEVRKIMDTVNVVCAGKRAAENKISAPPIPVNELKKIADYILIEADGSKRLPLKIPNKTEPVYPEGTDEIICVQGLSGVGKTFESACFRSIYAEQVVNKSASDMVGPVDVSRLITASEGLLWNAPAGIPITIVLNQADTDRARILASEIASFVQDSRINRMMALSLQNDFGGRYACFC